MLRFASALAVSMILGAASLATAGDLKGDYIETRTCDVYTGPCFANGQAGLTGNDAIMGFSIDQGTQDGVDLSGLKVVVVTNASDTLGFGGTLLVFPENIRSVIIVDETATPRQREALVSFAMEHATHSGEIVKVIAAPISLSVDLFAAAGKMQAGSYADIETRAFNKGDCVCSNEMTFYPPLCNVRTITPAYTVDAQFSGPGLGTQWSNPNTRSAFVASFSY